MRILLLLLFTITSCGTDCSLSDLLETKIVGTVDPRDTTETNPEFLDYVEFYEALVGRKVRNIPINFGEMNGDDTSNTLGQCRKWKTCGKVKFREIVIKKSEWVKSTPHRKEVLLLHELGHCDLNRKHSEDMVELEGFKAASSIMYPYNIADFWYYEYYRYYYLEEFRNFVTGE